jgi:hypothetical protein
MGAAVWLSRCPRGDLLRNVKPGQNYQEQIVKALRAATIMVLTANANNSNEISTASAASSLDQGFCPCYCCSSDGRYEREIEAPAFS